VTVYQGSKKIKTARVKATKGGSFRIVVKLKRKGAYSAKASVKTGGKTLSSTTRAKRI